jgi:hypothetical protein
VARWRPPQRPDAGAGNPTGSACLDRQDQRTGTNAAAPAAGLAWRATEALSFGVPLVATSLIADKLGPGGTEVALTADQPSQFAFHIVSRARDEALWSCQPSRGLAYTEKWQSPSVFEKSIALAMDAADSAMSARRNLNS